MGLLDCHGTYNNIILPYIKNTLAYYLQRMLNPSKSSRNAMPWQCMFALYVHRWMLLTLNTYEAAAQSSIVTVQQ